jgi:hypothetical protein
VEHEAEKRAAGEGESASAGVGLDEAHIRALLERAQAAKLKRERLAQRQRAEQRAD